MLLIFDLDDTLIETTKTIVPFKLKRALKKMIEAGLKVKSPKEALKTLIRMDARSLSSKASLTEFLELTNGLSFLKIGLSEIYEGTDLPEEVELASGAERVLRQLRKEHQLALVSYGLPHVQKAKMEKGGLDPDLFSSLTFAKTRDKKNDYQTVISNLSFVPSKVVVIGDRIAFDLTPAKELGCRTIHIRKGRGLGNTGLKTDVDDTILSLEQIGNCIQSYDIE